MRIRAAREGVVVGLNFQKFAIKKFKSGVGLKKFAGREILES